MSVLSYQAIRKAGVFDPFCERSIHEPTGMTYGCGAASYDVRLATDIYPMEGFVTLASTIEKFTMPNNICGVVHDKSSLARSGLLVQNTFIDPGWYGYLTLEISYHRCNPNLNKTDFVGYHKIGDESILEYIRLEAGTPIAQIVLHYLDQSTEQPYSGRYQNQRSGAQPAKINI